MNSIDSAKVLLTVWTPTIRMLDKSTHVTPLKYYIKPKVTHFHLEILVPPNEV